MIPDAPAFSPGEHARPKFEPWTRNGPSGHADTRAPRGILTCPRDLSVFTPDEIEVNHLPAGIIRLPVIITTRHGAGFVTSVSASVLGKTQRIITMSPLTASHLHSREIRTGLDESDPQVIAELSRSGAYQALYINMDGVRMDDGSRTLSTITVDAIVSGREVREIVQIPLQVTSLPKVPGWYGGDGHVHTLWSPDVVLLPIAERARHARDNGFGFIIITDHEDGIGPKWGAADGYCAQCLAAQKEYGLPVLPGAEIGVAGGGHCLAYSMDEAADAVPANRAHGAASLLRRIESHNRPHSYGIAAHPYEIRERWSDWSVRDLAGIEIINRSQRSRAEAVRQWFDLLNRDLAKTLRTGMFIVGLANSDCHNLQEPGGRGFTWIRPEQADAAAARSPVSCIPGGISDLRGSPLSRRSVWEAIRSGRVVASGSKDLGFFTLNGVGIGGIVRARRRSTLTFEIEHHPSAGRRCVKVTVYSGNGRETVLTPGKPGVPFRYEERCHRVNTFYVAKFDFMGRGSRRKSEVWTNPVFVSVAGP